MRINIRLLSAALIVLATAVPAYALAAGGPHGMAPRPVLVSAHGLTVRSTVGSYCVDSRSHRGVSSGACADAAYPLRLRGHLPVHGGERIALRFRHNPAIHDRVESAVVSAMRVTPSTHGRKGGTLIRLVRAEQSRAHPSRWHARLPSHLLHANTLDISARYSHHHGDADFWAGIRSRG